MEKAGFLKLILLLSSTMLVMRHQVPAVAGEAASLGIEAYAAPWTGGQGDIAKVFNDYGLPPSQKSGVLIVGFAHRFAKGLKLLDIVTEIKGKKLVNQKAYDDAMRNLAPGESSRIKILRLQDTGGKRKWKAVAIEVVALSDVELTAEYEERRNKLEKTVFRFSSELVSKTGEEIEQLNADNKKKVVKLIFELRDGILVRGPENQDFTLGADVIKTVVNKLSHREADEEAGTTKEQDLGSNWQRVDAFMRQYLKNNSTVDADFAASTAYGDHIAIFDNGTALFYEEIWRLAKERVR